MRSGKHYLLPLLEIIQTKCRSSDHPELQAKIRTAMIEGKIADEDFNGDPEYNVLGQSGIRGRATKKKAEAEDENDEEKVS